MTGPLALTMPDQPPDRSLGGESNHILPTMPGGRMIGELSTVSESERRSARKFRHCDSKPRSACRFEPRVNPAAAADLSGKGGRFPPTAGTHAARPPRRIAMKRYAYGRITALMRFVGGEKAEGIITDIDARYLRTHGHAKPHGHGDLGHE
jgi:hypothetical protein